MLLFQLIFRLGFWILYPSLKCWCAVYIKVWDAFWKKNSRHLKTNINKKKTNRILSGMKKKNLTSSIHKWRWFSEALSWHILQIEDSRKNVQKRGDATFILSLAKFFRCAMQHKFKLWNFFPKCQNVKLFCYFRNRHVSWFFENSG